MHLENSKCDASGLSASKIPSPQLHLRLDGAPAGAAMGGMTSMRCLGIDHGAKRIGLSYGDELGVATPLAALTDSSPRVRWKSWRR